MTLNGWQQTLFFLLAIFLVTPVIGGYMARVFTRQRTWTSFWVLFQMRPCRSFR